MFVRDSFIFFKKYLFKIMEGGIFTVQYLNNKNYIHIGDQSLFTAKVCVCVWRGKGGEGEILAKDSNM